MPAPRLGRLLLRWCPECDLPLVDQKECSICGTRTHQVAITPPGDMRPAFQQDIESIRAIIDQQFGEGCGEAIIPPDRIVVLNRAPGDDVLDEVVVGGRVVGTYRYDLVKGEFDFMVRIDAARALQGKLTKGFVVTDEDAVPFIVKGASVLAPGVTDAHPDIAPMDEVVAITADGKVFCCGSARMSGPQMVEETHGVSVKTRWKGERQEYVDHTKPSTWEKAVEANTARIEYLEQKAKAFIADVTKEIGDRDMAVSYSGGKDSLAALLLVLKFSTRKPKMLFIDTGLEFPQTIDNVNQVRDTFELELVQRNAGEAFWHALEHFGPPGRDFRWCCKSCKLGPTSMLIRESFPKGVVSFIGQRGKESEQRMKKGRRWQNPWVAGQEGVSPVQDWTALDVWLYIFRSGAPYNPLYEQGMERIGCWLCPASNMAELEIIMTHPEFPRFQEALQKHAEDRGYTAQWYEMGFWRFNKLPPGMRELRDRRELNLESGAGNNPPPDIIGLWVESDLSEGGLIEGTIKGDFSSFKLADMMKVFGGFISIKRSGDFVVTGCSIAGMTVKEINVSTDGKLTMSLDEKAMDVYQKNGKLRTRVRKRLLDVLRRSESCVGCGVCVGRCGMNAIKLDEETRTVLITDDCTACQDCFGKCPSVEYEPR